MDMADLDMAPRVAARANGAGMDIGYVGHSILQSPHSQIHLKNIMHVPKTNNR
jgi:hypothetical protein